MEKNMLFRHIPRSRRRLKPSIPDAEGISIKIPAYSFII